MPTSCRRLLLLAWLMVLMSSSGRAQSKAESVRLDPYGDPLPPQALFRVGSLRFQNGGSGTFMGFSPDGKMLVSVGEFGHQSIIRFWEVSTGRELRHFVAGRLAAFTSALSPDAEQLALKNEDPTRPNSESIHLVNARTGDILQTLNGLKGELDELTFSPDGKTLASGHERALYLWDTITGRQLRQIGGDLTHTCALAFSPDGQLLACRSADRTIRVWRIDGKEVHRWQVKQESQSALVFCADGKTLAACDWDSAIHFWDIPTGKYKRCVVDEQVTVHLLACSSDGRLLAFTARGTSDKDYIGLMNTRTGTIVRRWGGDRQMDCIAFSPDGRTLAAMEYVHGTIHLYDVTTGKEITPFRDPPFLVDASTLGKADSLLILGGRHGGIRIVDALNGKEVRRLTGPQIEIERLVAPPDGKNLFSISVKEPYLCRWDFASLGLRECSQDPHRRSSAVSPDGKLLIQATRSEDRDWIHVLDAISHEELRRISGHAGFPAFSSDSKVMAASDLWLVRRWDVTTGKEYPVLENREFLAFSNDGKTLALGDVPGRNILLHDTRTGKETIWPMQREEKIYSAAFSPDSRMLATGSKGGIIQLWEMTTGKERRRLVGHHGTIYRVFFSGNGKILVSEGLDATAVVWELACQGQRGQLAKPPAAQVDELWERLASDNSIVAYHAILSLASTPAQTVPFLKQKLQPVRAVESARFDRLIAQLNNNRFAVREEAMKEMNYLGESVKRPLENLTQQKTSAEVQSRVRQLLDKLAVCSGDRLREVRAVEALENIGTADARAVLLVLAQGLSEARLTRDAKAALERLGKNSN